MLGLACAHSRFSSATRESRQVLVMERLIKRYANRKMYDTRASRYVTLDGVADLVRSGEEVRIVDNETGEDLTALIFAQIIFEEEKRKKGLLELPVLRWIIRQGGATVQEILSGVDRGREALENVRELAEKGVKQWLHPSETGRVEAKGHGMGRRLIDDILEAPQKQLEQLQQRIDAQVRASVERFTAHPAIQKELRRLEVSLQNLERHLGQLRHKPPRSRPRRGKRPDGRRRTRPGRIRAESNRCGTSARRCWYRGVRA